LAWLFAGEENTGHGQNRFPYIVGTEIKFPDAKYIK
jgi:hypothetical protein